MVGAVGFENTSNRIFNDAQAPACIVGAATRQVNANGEQGTLVRSLRITDDGRVLLGEEGHSDSHFFLIFSDDRL